ncbi:sensor histidine kinase [Roseomonas marmotae]|uniref:histidine kinase n=1 Tax=Roseomonas marmotae TaxID=2768161 RepID=A0ABS3KE92_9PROT|nr:sensor histidine kinase [Roseomonas marmotae]MBO1075791.1 sensor histidine kinase [Roseomonas marmotae]QTI80515.1 sensor histidine kinase [Roseomonas marmotae]
MDAILPAVLGCAVLVAGLITRSARLERHRVEARLRQVERDLEARGRYLGLLSQEMQGHGLTLLGYATASRPGEAAPDACLAGRARALMGLAADVSDILARDAGPRVLWEADLPLGPLLEEAIGQITQSLAPGRRHWQVAPELRRLTLAADRRALSATLRQVLTRAVRHTRDGDSVQIRLVRADESVAILVEDDGSGHAGEDLNGLTIGQGTRGLGLGVLVADDLLRAHGGGLSIEAVPGIGTRVWLTLPRERVLEPNSDSP